MKKILLFIILSVLSIVHFASAQTSLTSAEKQQIIDTLQVVEEAVNSGDVNLLDTVISDSVPLLSSEAQDAIRGGIKYDIDYSRFDDNTTILDQNTIETKVRYSATGPGWNVSGLSASFVLKKEDGQWMIVETDFHQKLGPEFVMGFVGKIFLFIIPVFILFGLFWLWMLIDCIRREFDNKIVWIIVIIALGGLGAILYYFMIKRKNVSNQNNTTL
jgi:hypothetical protein